MKKNLFPIFCLVFLIIPAIMSAAVVSSGSSSLDKIIIGVVNAVAAVATAAAVISLLYAAILFLTASGEPDKITKAKKAFLWGIAGVIIAIIASSIFTIVGYFL